MKKDKPVILIVDDQPQNIELLEAYLAPQDYEIITAANGEEALEKISGNQIDLILLDIIMPGMDGFEVTRRIRQDNTHRLLPIIMVTVLQETEDRIKGIEAGCDDFISKPIDKTELLARVRSLLKVKAYNDLQSNYRDELESEVNRRTGELKRALENLRRDIIERKRAEENLRESDERYKALFDHSLDLIYITDFEGRFIDANDAALNRLGYTREDIRSLNFASLLSEDQLPLAFKTLQDIRETGIHESLMELRLRHKNGSDVYVETRGSAIMSNGTPVAIQAIARDITERKQTQDALRASEELFRNYLEYAPDGVYMSDVKGTFLYGNRKCEEIIGYLREELIGKNFLELNILPEKSLNKAVQLLQANMEGKSTGPDEIELISKEGRLIPVEISTSVVQRMDQRIVLAFVRDVTERKKVEKALRESEEKYRWVLNNIADVIVIMDMNLRFTYVSPSIMRMRGYTAEEATAQTFEQVMTPESLQIVAKVFEEEMKLEASGTADAGRIRIVEVEQYRKDGSIVLMENNLSFLRDTAHKPVGIISVSRDITDRRRAEETLKTSEERFRTAAENLTDVVYDWDIKEKVEWYGDIDGVMGYPPGGFPRTIGAWAATIHPEDKARVMAALEGHVKGVAPFVIEYRIRRRDGEYRWWSARGTALRDNRGKPYKMIGSISDITERKQAEEAFRESEGKYRTILEDMDDVYFETDIKGNVTFVNPSSCKMSGYSEEELLGMPFKKISAPDDIGKIMQYFGEIFLTGKTGKPFLWNLVKKNGEQGFFEIVTSLVKNKNGKPIGFRGIGRDVTERKRAEEKMKESESKYRLLADNIDDVIFVLDMNLNYTYVSPSVKILMGYEQEELLKLRVSETMTPSSWDLATKNLVNVIELEKSEHGENPPYQMLQFEMRRKDGTTVWTEVKASFIRDENQRPVGIICLSRDITERKRAEEELQRTLESLNNAFGATVQVMVSAIESRDPYTSGHQLRAANLACAIAVEMGLPQDKIEGLRMAGSIHDIGKLSIPAEILSKPTKLTNIEFSLIKEHSQKGYDMLKDVKSPWPLAQIVYQHHERMDGSGYPRNLKGDEILMEARIMAVADVVEAMASHRPYRPGLGIDAALAEIEKNKGIFYDNTVADACIRLFREKGYQLEGTRL